MYQLSAKVYGLKGFPKERLTVDDRKQLVACLALALCPDGLFVAESTRRLNGDFELTPESKLKLREGDIVIGAKRVVQADPEVNIQETRVLDLATKIPWDVVTSKFGARLVTEMEEPFYDPDHDEVRVLTIWRLDGRIVRTSITQLKTAEAPLYFGILKEFVLRYSQGVCTSVLRYSQGVCTSVFSRSLYFPLFELPNVMQE